VIGETSKNERIVQKTLNQAHHLGPEESRCSSRNREKKRRGRHHFLLPLHSDEWKEGVMRKIKGCTDH